MASGIVAASQVPDPSETGLFDALQRPRVRNYRLLDGNYTYAPKRRLDIGIVANILRKQCFQFRQPNHGFIPICRAR